MQFEGCAAEPLTTIMAVLPGSKWSCLLFTHCFAGCVERSHKNLSIFEKLRVFVDDNWAFGGGTSKEVPEMAKNVMKKLKEEVDKKGIKLSVTENGKEGKQDDCVLWIPGE